MKKNAIALRRYSVGDIETPKGAVVWAMDISQFESFEASGLVRAATADEELEASRAEEAAPPPARKPAKR